MLTCKLDPAEEINEIPVLDARSRLRARSKLKPKPAPVQGKKRQGSSGGRWVGAEK